MIAMVRPDLTYKITGIPERYLCNLRNRIIVLKGDPQGYSDLLFGEWTWRREWLLNIREEEE